MRVWSVGVALWALMRAAAPAALDVSFHHIHVNDVDPSHLVGYYARLFRGDTTRPARLGEVRGIESNGLFLLIDASRGMPPERGSAGWHFGWGTVSVDEAYDRHRMQEIEWQLPLESFAKDLHVHLESADPIAAAGWYRDVFGARLEVSAQDPAAQPTRDFYRRPTAIARLDKIALAIYKSAGPLEPSRGHRIDHIAFKADLAEIRERTDLHVLNAAGRLGTLDTMIVEGPDRLAIELVGRPSFPAERDLGKVQSDKGRLGPKHQPPSSAR